MLRHAETLARVPLFRSIDAADIGRLDTQCSWRRAPAKDWIIDYQDEGSDVFFVVTGTVRVMIRSVTGQDVILRDIDAGGFFGELAALDGRARSAGIVAVTDAVVARMPAPVFRDAIHRHPDVCDQVMQLMASQIRMLANRVNEFSTLDVRHRIYAELLRLGRRDREVPGRAILSPPPVHADIAARVSTRREAVARTLKALERQGLLERRRGALVVTDTELLASMIDRAAEGEA
ncbi:Crp/Fnr family transcriptional regulator [Arenibaculum pallidiluteum]|uniref:Crp/Fnr family transcriptional regulator n=1 Tax=Arenibaculum pallidiluteum TaxID=2812559 RepID=UPI001A9689AB|nr:Crp/Fnr family transcriptional regulator [Arenibaculum pallidiluteum]